MKIISTLIALMLVPSVYGFNEVQSKMVVSGSQLCIKSYSRKKCSSDSFTKAQNKKTLKKIHKIQERLPTHIVNDALNHFWANNHKFTSAQLLSLFDNSKDPQCGTKIEVQKKRSNTIQNKIISFKKVLKSMDKEVAKACMNPKLAEKIYP